MEERAMPGLRPLAWAATLALVATVPAAAQAPSPLGRWLTDGGKSHVEIYACAPHLCGRIVWLREPANPDGKPKVDRHNPDAAKRNQPIVGLVMLWGFKPADGERGVWDNGRIYNPEDGDTYRSTLTLDGNGTLRVRGYVGVPLLGKTQVWSRVR
jgi:uncharacterized protein (DUF2147 family)